VHPAEVVIIPDEHGGQALAAFLIDRIYEFNSKATGYSDGMVLAGCMRNAMGEVIAGFNGHTWGGSCELVNLWVHEQHRAKGYGSLLLRSAEKEALARGCAQVVVRTHSFQAPHFYERLGYERRYVIAGLPKNHSDIIYTKVLA